MKTTNSLPKYWAVKSDTSNPNWKKVITYLNKIYGRDWYRGTDNAYYGFDGSTFYKGTNVYCDLSSFKNTPVVLTIEEFVEMTELQTNKSKETMKTITHTQAQQIIDVACSTWKDKLFEKWGKAIVLKQSIEIPETYYQCMRSACTSEQHQLFDEIFGKDEPSFKIGDWVYAERSDDDWRDDAKYIPTFQIKEFSKGNDYARPESGKTTGIHVDNLRFATQEEIEKSQYIPEGTPCLARDGDGYGWRLCYSNGNGRFKWTPNGKADKFEQVQVLDMKNLPKY